MSEEEFNELVERYLAGRASPEEENLIDEFFQAHQKDQTLLQYKVSDEMWACIESAIQKSVFPRRKGPSRKDIKARPVRSLGKIIAPVAIAASLSLAVGIAYFMDAPSQGQSKNWVTSRASMGQKSIVTLGDGSKVYLNSGSSISYPSAFDNNKREVILSGEAFFEVARDEKRSFIVRSGDLETRVLGTSFNINAHSQEQIRVAVATGEVQVKAMGKKKEKKVLAPVLLASNEQATYSVEDGSLTTARVDINKIIAWKNQTLYFDGATMEEVARQLERWYNVSIEFENENVKHCSVNGQYKGHTIQEVLTSIGYMHPVEYTFETPAKILLYGKGCSKQDGSWN